MDERKQDADLHYQQAVAALNRVHPGRENQWKHPADLEREATHRIALAHVSAIREQTAVLERIAQALERWDVVEIQVPLGELGDGGSQ